MAVAWVSFRSGWDAARRFEVRRLESREGSGDLGMPAEEVGREVDCWGFDVDLEDFSWRSSSS